MNLPVDLMRAFGASPDALAIVDREGIYRYVNDAGVVLFGYPREEVVGRHFRSFLVSDATSRGTLERAQLGTSAWTRRHVRRRDGSVVVIDSVLTPLGPDAVLINGRDVTAEARSQQALQESEALLERAQVLAALGSWEIELQTDAFRCSPNISRLLGLPVDAPLLSLSGLLACVHPDDRSGLTSRIERARAHGEPWEHQYRIIRPDGSVRWFRDAADVVRDSTGSPARIDAVVRDVTEQVALEQAAAISAAEFEGIFHAAPRPIVLLNDRGVLLRANPAVRAVFGVDPDTLTGRDVDLLMGSAAAAAVHGYIASALVGAANGAGALTAHTIEVQAPRANRAWFPAELTMAELPRTDAGARFICIVMDLTDRRLAEAQLVQAQKNEALGTLLAGVAHDFNNILTVIGSAFQIMRLTPDHEAWIERGEVATQRAADLVRQLLQYARREQVAYAAVDVEALVRETTALFRESIDRRIVLREDIAPDLPLITGNSGQLQQVLLNLLVNARDAVLERLAAERTLEPQITLRISSGHDQAAAVLIAVQDNGNGIPVEARDRILDPFFTTKGPGSGTGLGLATSYSIVGQHGGSIGFDTRIGGGTTFTVRLPAGPPVAPTADEPGLASIQSIAGRRILVADDEPTLREVAAVYLRDAGARVLTAEDGLAALAVLEQEQAREPVDLVLLDANMPRMDGWALLDQVRERWPELPVVMLTGYVAADVAHDRTPDAIILKPYEHADLLRTVAQAMSGVGRTGEASDAEAGTR